MKPKLNLVIGLRVRQARERAGLTQEKLAELVDRTKEAISNIERGVNYPAIDTLQRISDAVRIPIACLLEETRGSRPADEIRAAIDMKLHDLSERDLRMIASVIDALIERNRT